MKPALQRLSLGQSRPRVGKVTSVSLADSSCMVLVNEGEVPAYLTDHVWNTVVVGAVVTLLPVGDTYEVISTRSGTTGSGGLMLGPELLSNNGFEYGTTGPIGWSAWPWVSGNYSTARDTTPGEMVSGAARLTVTLGSGTDNPDVNVWPDAVSVDPGIEYQTSVWVKASAIEATLAVSLTVLTAPTASGAQIFGTGVAGGVIAALSAPGAAYQLLTGSLTVPAGHHFARPYLRSTANATIPAPVVVSWDEVSLRQRITS